MELKFDENSTILNVEIVAPKTTGYTQSPGFYEISDIKLMSESLLPSDVQVNVESDDLRLRMILTINDTL